MDDLLIQLSQDIKNEEGQIRTKISDMLHDYYDIKDDLIYEKLEAIMHILNMTRSEFEIVQEQLTIM